MDMVNAFISEMNTTVSDATFASLYILVVAVRMVLTIGKRLMAK